MSIWAIVPAKASTQAKSRLARELDGEARSALSRTMLARTIDALHGSGIVAAVIVVSRDPALRALALERGAQAMDEPEPGDLNAAVRAGIARARAAGAHSALIVPTDLPLIDAASIRELGAAHPAADGRAVVTLCPDRHEQGTNALLVSPPGALDPAFGAHSFEHHLARAQAAGASVGVAHVPRLMLDLDTPDDMRLYQAESPLYARRSVRRYRPDEVSVATIERLVSAASWAPSAHNRQPWRFVAILTQDLKDRLARAMGDRLRVDRLADGTPPDVVDADVVRSQQRITGAPALILACMTSEDMDHYPDPQRAQAEHTMATQSVAMALQNLLLAAHAEGLGACWMCAPLFCPQIVLEALQLPPHWEPQSLVTLGYPASDAKAAVRRPLADVLMWR